MVSLDICHYMYTGHSRQQWMEKVGPTHLTICLYHIHSNKLREQRWQSPSHVSGKPTVVLFISNMEKEVCYQARDTSKIIEVAAVL